MLQGRHRQKAGIFHDHFMVLRHIKEGERQLRIVNGQNLVYVGLQIGEQLVPGSLNRGAVGNGVDMGDRHHLPGLQGRFQTGGPGGFHGYDLNFRVQKLGQSGNAGAESAASHRNQDIIHRRQLFNDLHCDAALAGGDLQIVKGMDKSIAVFVSQLIGMGAGLVKHIAVQNHVGPQRPGPVHLN